MTQDPSVDNKPESSPRIRLRGVRRSTPEELLSLGVPVEDWHPKLQEEYNKGKSS